MNQPTLRVQEKPSSSHIAQTGKQEHKDLAVFGVVGNYVTVRSFYVGASDRVEENLV